MYNPNDDPDVISGLCDDAKKEMATTPGTSHSAPAAKMQPPTPPPARLGAPGSPGQQDHMEVLSDEGPPTSPPVNGSERMQVDDSRTNRTYHSTDETMPGRSCLESTKEKREPRA